MLSETNSKKMCRCDCSYGDRISMVSNITLMYINYRLCEIYDTIDKAWFGGKNIIVFGDFLQLPPVKADNIFMNISNDLAKKYSNCSSSINLWKKLFQYEELKINMRQKNDYQYS